MGRIPQLLLLAVFGGFLTGCSHSASQDAQANTSSPSPQKGFDDSTPAHAVQSFLQAVKQGDDGQVSALLTELARQKTKELEMEVAPPGSDTATFEVGQVEEAGKDAAHVASTWSDLDQNGDLQTHQITWIVKREHGGWRLAGMATPVFAGEEPTLFNFENPADMLKQREVAEREATRRANEQNSHAARGEDPFQATER